MAVDINEAFKDLFIVLNDKPLPLNVIGTMQIAGKELVVLNDMQGLVGEDEYIIFELTRNHEQQEVSLLEITDMEFYDHVCDLWDKHINELVEGGQSIDS